MDLMTNSRLKAARSCSRYHKLRYVEGWKAAQDADALRFGTLVHLGLEAWWTATGEARLEAAIAAMGGMEADPFDRVRAEELLLGYHVRWGDEPYETLAVEHEFRTELRNPETGAASRTWELGGKLDVVARDLRDGRVLIVEHKTSGENIEPGSEYWRKLRMDGQVSIYFVGARAAGFDVQGCLYDVLGKPKLTPLKATPMEARKYTKEKRLYSNQRELDETAEEYRLRIREALAGEPNRYFQRGEVTRLERDLDEALYDIWQTSQLVRESVRTGRAPRNPDACVRPGRMCEFFDVCTGAASLEDAARFVRLDTVHPELAAEAGHSAA